MMYRDKYKTTLETEARDDLMLRVKTVQGTRASISSPMTSATFAALFFFCTTILVSVGDVMHNIMAQGGWAGRFAYTFSSLLHSRIIVQALALLLVFSCCVLLLKSARKLRTPLSFVGNFITSVVPLKLFRS